jgi:hypothetical protein
MASDFRDSVYQSLRTVIRLFAVLYRFPVPLGVLSLPHWTNGSAGNSRKIGGPAAKGPRTRGRRSWLRIANVIVVQPLPGKTY